LKNNQLIIEYISKNGSARVPELLELNHISRQMVHRILLKLIEEGKIIKTGKAPKTYYSLVEEAPAKYENIKSISSEKEEFLKKHFLLVTELGKRLTGVEAMRFWCERQKLPLEKTIDEFINTRKKYLQYYNAAGLIPGIEKLKGTKGFSSVGPNELYYLDFYTMERFGKTRLGTLLHFAKQGQNKKLMYELFEEIKPILLKLIRQNKIDSVGFIPPTIKREVQLMGFMEKQLNLPLPHFKIAKVSGEIVVPQKALSKLEDRIANAKASLLLEDKRPFKRLLLIDDAVGSGATINEVALKIKHQNPKIEITGLAITGSYKGFEVIQEI
jgi:hypothetical protein